MSTNSSRYRSARRRACSSSTRRSSTASSTGSIWNSAGVLTFVFVAISESSREHGTELEQRPVQREQQRRDHDAHNHEEHWLHQGHEPFHAGGDLLVKEV